MFGVNIDSDMITNLMTGAALLKSLSDSLAAGNVKAAASLFGSLLDEYVGIVRCLTCILLR